MLTKNFKNMIYGYLTMRKVDLLLTTGSVYSSMEYNYATRLFDTTYANTNPGTSYRHSWALGSGTTKETEYDTDVEQLMDILTCNSHTVTTSIASNSIHGDEEIRYVVSFTNNTTDNIIVSEIGWFYMVDSTKYVMLYRKTFDPVTFAPGETKTFTITLS